MELLQTEQTCCCHCGDPCDETIHVDDHHFCCYGCKAIHELLHQNGLNGFYDETSLANKSISELKAERKFSFLDHEDLQRQLLSFKSDRISVIRFFLPGIHCSSCIYLLEHLPKIEKRILKGEVNFIKKEITVSFLHEAISLRDVAVLLSQLGYPPGISLDCVDQTKKQIAKSDIGAKIAVSGFCFGNAMLMSMPEYLDQKLLLTESFKHLFGWVNLVLSLPVLFYSARDYFSSAWKGILNSDLNIDVPITMGIMTLAARSFYEVWTQTGVGYIDSLAGLVFFLLIGKWYQSRSYQALSFDRDYSAYFPISVTCLIEGQEYDRPIKELRKGDVIVVHNDELIPVDGTIRKGAGNIDYSFVTGESQPQAKGEGSLVYAGGRQKGGELIIKLEKAVNTSELTQLWNSDAFQKDQKSLQTKMDQISKYFTLGILLIAMATGVYWWWADATVIWNAMTAVLIVACPCALALVLPFAYGHAMRLLGYAGLYLKNATVIEMLAKVDHVIFDKTGTLTGSSSSVSFQGVELSEIQLQVLRTALGNSAHPLSKVIYQTLPEMGKLPMHQFEEEVGKGFRAGILGHEVIVGSAKFLQVEEAAEVSNESHVHVSIGGYVGYFRIKLAYREGVFGLLERLRKTAHLSLLSGDNEKEYGKLAPYFDQLRFKQKPMDKLEYIEGLKGVCLMVGDGLNDAGALKSAEVGMAVSEDIHQFSPACDAILSAKTLTKIPGVLSFSRLVMYVVFVAFGISFLYNIVGLSFAVMGHLTPLISAILMPISSVTVVGFVTLMVSLTYKRVLKKEEPEFDKKVL